LLPFRICMLAIFVCHVFYQRNVSSLSAFMRVSCVQVPAGIPLTPTQYISLQHGDGKTSDVIVWPRPEAANFELARYVVRQRYLAGPDTPSARGYRWPPGSRGAAKAPPSPPESHSPRRPSSPPVSSSPSYRTANLLDSTAHVAQAATKRDPYVAEPLSDLDDSQSAG